MEPPRRPAPPSFALTTVAAGLYNDRLEGEWSTRTTIASWVSIARPTRRRSSVLIGAWPCSFTPTRTPATTRLKTSSRRSTKPTRCSATPASAPSTISSAPGVIRVEMGDLDGLFGGGFSDFFQTIFGSMAAASAARASGAARGPAIGGRDPEPRVGISLEEAFPGTRRQIRRDGRTLEVKIPAGASSGTRIRVAGQGESGRGTAGDLFLLIDVGDDPRFTRDGDDLHVEVEVALYAAVLGGAAHVPTPAGPVVLK